MNLEDVSNTLIKIVSSKEFYIPIITVLCIVIIIRISAKLVKKLINKNSSSLETKRKNTIVSLIQNILKYLLIFIGALIILSSWGVNVNGFVAGLGIAGVVGGLALQDALKDIIMGCNIILDNYYVVGDLVTFNGFTGEVIEFGLKNTKIKNSEGTVLVVANREIVQIYNLSKKTSNVQIKIPVAYEETEEKVTSVINKILEEVDTWEEVTDKTEYLGIDGLEESSVDYLIRAHCKGENRFTLRRKMLSLIKSEFDKNNIKIPYKQVEVHNGQKF